MNLGFVLRYLTIAATCACASGAHAATVWDEAVNGSFSDDGLVPTPVSMTIGSNRVLGITGNGGQGVGRDYFKFTVPAGAMLSSIILLANTQTAGVSFIGIQPGPQLTVTPSGGGVEQLVGLGHFSTSQIGTDLLPIIKVGAQGPLPSGTYSVWVQELSGPIPYGFDFVISSTGGSSASVPTLPEWGMLLLGILLACLMWRHAGKGRRAWK
jgi:hypothetical protein